MPEFRLRLGGCAPGGLGFRRSEDRRDFAIVNPIAKDNVVRADAERNYWVNKWSGPQSYQRYQAANQGKLPSHPTQYQMFYSINGRTPVVDRRHLKSAGPDPNLPGLNLARGWFDGPQTVPSGGVPNCPALREALLWQLP